MKYSPGLEEYALLIAFEDTIRQYADQYEALIFDMPPTALTMKFFSLPSITLVWLAELLHLRQKINAKKEIISKIKIGRKEIERDRVITRLHSMMAGYQRLQALFQSDSAHLHLVVNDDTLSVAEGRRIQEKLADIDLSPRRILVNRLHAGSIPHEIQQAFHQQALHPFPFSPADMVGLNVLADYIYRYPQAFQGLELMSPHRAHDSIRR
jgi:arsenite-transporting ATPase